MIETKTEILPIVPNPMCEIIIGFKSYIQKITNSKYVSFKIEDQDQMCRMLLDFSRKKITSDTLKKYNSKLINKLIDFGFLMSSDKFNFIRKLLHKCNLINENRNAVLHYRNKKYYVTSFIFMAFMHHKPGEYIKETFILPFFCKNLAEQVYQLLHNNFRKSVLKSIPKKHIKGLIKHGVITNRNDMIALKSFFQKECKLNEKLLELVPIDYRLDFSQYSNGDDFQLNPNLYIPENNDIPNEISKEIIGHAWIRENMPTLWVRDIVTGVLNMYWLDRDSLNYLIKLKEGQLSILDLPKKYLRYFIYADIISTVQKTSQRKIYWDQLINQGKNQMMASGCILLKQILPPVQLAIARKFMQYKYKNKQIMLDKANGKTKQRFWVHADKFTFYLQNQLAKILNQMLEEPVKAAHNALTYYKPGSLLPKHTDDVKAFNWVISLSIDFDPEEASNNPWPIYVETKHNPEEKVLLGMGDAVILNPQLPHWRNKLQDHTLGILLMWFVPEKFVGYVNGRWIE